MIPRRHGWTPQNSKQHRLEFNYEVDVFMPSRVTRLESMLHDRALPANVWRANFPVLAAGISPNVAAARHDADFGSQDWELRLPRNS